MGDNSKVVFKIAVLLGVFSAGICDVKPMIPMGDMLNPSKPIGDCKACKLFVESFKKGLERTARGKYEGGDAAWEEEKLKTSYKRSEMRLVDIQEGICKDQTKHSTQCHSMAEKAEEVIEQWWAQDPDESSDLYDYICIDKLQVCCPEHHYGRDCTPCHGDLNNLCNGNGKCRGDGTRKGNGTCLCDTGYTGQNCDQCLTGYYLAYKDDSKMLCSPCHASCMGGCTKGSRKDCVACRPGFTFDKEEGCLDVNECNEKDICKSDEFCLNSLGAYTCMKCDRSCEGCYGDGPDMCRKCAKGYSKQGELCIREREDDNHLEKMTQARKEDL